MNTGKSFPLIPLLVSCATAPPDGNLGKPIALAVAEYGPPHFVANYPGGRRAFTWSTSDVVVSEYGSDNSVHWLERELARPVEPLSSGPEVTLTGSPLPAYRQRSCTLSLIANWSPSSGEWVVQRTVRLGAGARGHCSSRRPDR